MAGPDKTDVLDADLWNAFRRGDETAFGQIAHRFYKSLFNYGVKFSKDREFVKDCLQDLFMELWYKRETLGDTEFVKFYLLKSLRRKIYKESLKQQWLTTGEELDFDGDDLGELSIEQQIIDGETHTFQIQQLTHHLTTLSKRQQEIIYLKFYENLDNESIAQVMSISRPAVANLLYRTIQELKSRF
ncbi:sigma-70 family RNA polymerase sigma factor [Spirosoma terrae]|uniref:Sigma-70 family RNA polymerase sigma factor n=1 Tax=Spirosoma terrae TaxID=1968276 RepID=A0A6L9LJF5_9BACT|nr:sigma-70 family RNA polymerase sigma factor [Spirosoma terrae]NDU98868.1 sigma-70 family RNA polymerase sigma factor [Spirosoma terrae]